MIQITLLLDSMSYMGRIRYGSGYTFFSSASGNVYVMCSDGEVTYWLNNQYDVLRTPIQDWGFSFNWMHKNYGKYLIYCI